MSEYSQGVRATVSLEEKKTWGLAGLALSVGMAGMVAPPVALAEIYTKALPNSTVSVGGDTYLRMVISGYGNLIATASGSVMLGCYKSPTIAFQGVARSISKNEVCLFQEDAIISNECGPGSADWFDSYGTFVDKHSTGYLGLKFNGGDEDTANDRYGWMQVEVFSNKKVQFIAWGFEDSGASIKAGDTGAPSVEQHPLTVAVQPVGAGTVASSPDGITCGGDCTEELDEGIEVTLTASPAEGYRFAGWSGVACSGTGPCTVTMDAARNVTARFVAEEARSDLGVALGVDAVSPELGDRVTLSLTVRNNGPDDATGVRVFALLPMGLDRVEDDGKGAYDSDLGTWNAGSLTAGEEKKLHVSARVSAKGKLHLGARIMDVDQKDPDVSDDEARLNLTARLPVGTFPWIVGANVADGDTDIPANIAPKAFFGEAMDPGSLSPETVTLLCKGEAVPFGVTYNPDEFSLTLVPTKALSSGSACVWTISKEVMAISGASPSADRVIRFTTVVEGEDQDSDGVPDNLEAYPGDSRRVTVRAATNTGAFELDASSLEGSASFAEVKTLSDCDPTWPEEGKPDGLVFPDGLLAYKVVKMTPGTTLEVPVHIPSGIPSDARVYKVQKGKAYVDITDLCRMEGDTLYLRITDGGRGDEDGLVNGEVKDPFGVAVLPAAPDVDNDSGGSCFIGATQNRGLKSRTVSFGLLVLAVLGGGWSRLRRGLFFGLLFLACSLPLKTIAVAGPLSLAVGGGFATGGSETSVSYKAQESEFTVRYALYPVLRLNYAVSDHFSLELGARYDRYRWDVKPSLNRNVDSDLFGVTVGLGPVWYFDPVKHGDGENGRFFVQGGVIWRYLDADLDYPVGSYKSAPGLEFAGGFQTTDHWEWRFGASWSRHESEEILPGTLGTEDLELMICFFDLAYRFGL